MAPLDHVRRGEHRHQPARADRARTRPTATSTSSCSWPRAAARPTRATCSRRRRRCSTPTSLMRFLDEKLRTLGTAACPPYHLARRDRRHVGRVRAEDREVRVGALPRHAARRRQRARPRLPRPRARAAGARAHAAVRHRRAVRRQVLLPRRARDPAAAPRRVVPGRASRCRAPPTARRSARSPPTACSSSSSRPTRRSTSPRSPTTTSPATTSCDIDLNRPMARSAPTLSKLPGEDARDAHRADGRGARHRPRQDQGAPRRRRGDARSTCATTACTTRARRRRPTGYASGSFGPTTAGRMDSYVDQFQAQRRQRS